MASVHITGRPMPIFSLHIGLSFFVRAVKLAKFSYTLRKTIHLGRVLVIL